MDKDESITFALGFFVGFILMSIVIDKFDFTGGTMDYVIKFAIGLASAFFGAYFALKFRENEENKKVTQQRVNTLNNCLFLLFRQINAVEILLNKMEKPHLLGKNSLYDPALVHADYSSLKQSFEDLNFVIALGYSKLLMKLSIGQESFEVMLKSIEVRNNHYLEKVKPMMDLCRKGEDFDGDITFDAEKNFNEMKNITKENFSNFKVLIGMLSELIKSEYSGHSPIENKFS